jgi:thymidine kinase
MVNLLTGQKGSGKTQQMIEAANKKVKECDGNVIFIKNSHNDTYSLSFDIRVTCMADYPSIRNVDDYTGFIYGMLSANSDIQVIFIDGILKQSDIALENIPRFVERLNNISNKHGVDFYVSVSANKEDLAGVNPESCKFL